MKKTLALFVLLAAAPLALADTNLLRNGDFSSGIAEWEGDCHTPDADPVDLSGTAAPTSGIVVKLRGYDWTKVMQDFNGKIGDYVLTITYSVSPGLKFSDKIDDYTNIPGKVDFSRLKPFSSAPGRWVVIVNDIGAMHYRYWEITPNLTVSGLQRITARVQLDSDDADKKGFYLLFPPGDGTISLQSITLVPAAATAGNP